MLIKVDKKDQAIGTVEKLNAHLGKGTLHRAFTCIIKNSNNQFLLTKRSLYKPLWPTFWDLSFSSHPEKDQALAESIITRAQLELGIKINPPQLLFNYYYHSQWSDLFSEHEINHLYIAESNHNLDLNPKEISQAVWLDKKSLFSYISANQDFMAPWIMIPLNKIKKLI